MFKQLQQLKKHFSKKKRKTILPKKKKTLSSETLGYKRRRKKQQLSFNFQKIDILSLFGNNLIYAYASLVFLFILSIVFLLFGPYSRIENIKIYRLDDLTNNNISYNAVSNFRNDNIFLFKEKKVEQKLKNYQENISFVDIETVLPNTLNIHISSSPAYFNTIFNGKQYIITQNGSFVPHRPKEELKNITIFTQKTKNQFLDYKKILNQKFLDTIYRGVIKLEENIIELKVANLEYYEIERELHITLENGNILLYNLNGDVNKQIEKTVIFHKEQKSISSPEFVYIDFRIDNKIFFCTTEEEFQCIMNLKKIYSPE